MDELIGRLRRRMRRSPAIECDESCVRFTEPGEILGPRRPDPPVPHGAMDALERELGFRFPTPIRRLYTEVADGGYGPAWGINRLRQPPGVPADPTYPEMMSVEAWYRLDREEWGDVRPPEYWPHPLIRFCEVGCNIFIGVDCSSDEGPVIMYDPNLSQHDGDCLVPVADSLAGWLTHWLDRTPWPQTEYP